MLVTSAAMKACVLGSDRALMASGLITPAPSAARGSWGGGRGGGAPLVVHRGGGGSSYTALHCFCGAPDL